MTYTKSNDNYDKVYYRATTRSGEVIDLTGASIQFKMESRKGELLVNSPGTITNATNGEMEYQLKEADTFIAGLHKAEFTVTFSDGKEKTFPEDGYIQVNITRDIDTDRDTANQEQVAIYVSEIEAFKTDISNDHEAFKTSVNTTINDYGVRLDSVEAEQVDQDARIDNLVANTGDSNSEIVDGRLGADNVARPVIGDLLREVHKEQLLSNQQKKTLVHGVNIVNSDIPSSMKVEFHGDTKVNLLGKIGNCEDVSKLELWNVSVEADTTNKVYGSNGIKITLNATKTVGSAGKRVSVKAGKYYIALSHVKNGNATNGVRLEVNGVTSSNALYTGTSSFQLQYQKFTPTVDEDKLIHFGLVNGSETQYAYTDGVRVFEVSSTVYNEIGVSLTDADVERMFPYVDSIKGVKHPMIKVEGQQLFNIYDVDLHANAEITDPRTITLNATGAGQRSELLIPALPNTKYTLSHTGSGKVDIDQWRSDGTVTSFAPTSIINGNITFTTNSDTAQLKFYLTADSAGTYTFKDVMFNLGELKPYTDYNSDYLYAETTLYGNSVKKDILTESDGTWYKYKNFETVVLDGSLSWSYVTDDTGYKIISLPVNNPKRDTQQIAKYDGKILNIIKQGTTLASTSGDISRLQDDGLLYMTIFDTDSGWGEDYTPTASEMSANFYNWRMCDGTYGTPYNGTGTKTWYPKGDSDLSRAVTTVPTSNAPTVDEGVNKNYFLLYQRSTPKIEVEGIDFPIVEGDVSIPSGGTIVDVGELVQVREGFVPVLNGDYYYVNDTFSSNSVQLNHKLNEVIDVYKNGEIDTHNWRILKSSGAYGNYHLSILKEVYDSTADYSISYTGINEGNSTHLNEVKATFSSSLKSSFQSQVSKLSDVATEVSIHDRQILDMMIRLDALEGGV